MAEETTGRIDRETQGFEDRGSFHPGTDCSFEYQRKRCRDCRKPTNASARTGSAKADRVRIKNRVRKARERGPASTECDRSQRTGCDSLQE
jgi:hypothetical protein